MTVKTLIAATLIGSATAFAGFVQAAERSVTLLVPGMYCASCPYVVEAALKEVEGVLSVSADLDSRTAVVVYDDTKAGIDDLTFATEAAGYESRPVEAAEGGGS